MGLTSGGFIIGCIFLFTGKWANNWAAFKSHFKVYGKAPTNLTPQVSKIFRGEAACRHDMQVCI